MSVRPFSIRLRSTLMVTTRVSMLATTGWSVLGRSGTFARNRAGFNGDTTMKIISKTSSTSMSGVTLIWGFARVLGRDRFDVAWRSEVMTVVLLDSELDKR